VNPLERDLREALRRKDAPPYLAERLLTRTRQSRMQQAVWIWIAAAALLVLMIGGIGIVREQRRQAEGEQAKQQLMVGLRITGFKLSQVQERLARLQQRVVQPRLEQAEQ
jgi:hypothetical protein